MRRAWFLLGWLVVVAVSAGTSWPTSPSRPASNAPPDEAKRAGVTAAYFKPPPRVPDYFAGMDAVSEPARGELPDELLDKRPGRGRAARAVVSPPLSPSEVLGRNTWMLWCGGNEGFWDWLSGNSHGFLDLAKVLDTRRRAARWHDGGIVNEPGLRAATEADPWGMWLDEPADPDLRAYRQRLMAEAFRRIEAGSWNGAAPAGQPTGAANAYGEDYGDAAAAQAHYAAVPPPAVYGFSSGVIGLRLFPNPAFRGAARARWDAKRYYGDPSYYNDPNLVRPYRVGMSCAFCHTSAHPLDAPLDPAAPRWNNLSGSIGSQYLRSRAVFGNMLTPDSFVYHILDSQPPGTIDTSLVASDNINNPNTMNAIFGVPARVARSFDNPREKLSPPAAGLPSLWPDPAVANAPPAYRAALPKLADSNGDPRYVPHILLDGADSIGALGALARVYLNIGTYHEQWVRLHEPLVGVLPPEAASDQDLRDRRTQLPFKLADCEANSVYWQATEDRVGPLRDYFLRITPTMPLLDAKAGGDGAEAQRIDSSKLPLGRKVFARNCIACHSSIQPETATFAPDRDRLVPDGPTYAQRHHDVIGARQAAIAGWEASGELWDHDPGQWLRDKQYLAWAEEVVEDPAFWRNNYLSSELRLPINYIGTNSGRAMATNAVQGHMWEDFASDAYRHMPSVGPIAYYNPFSDKDEYYTPRHKVADGVPAGGGGPGFYRPPSLLSAWATAPFLHNNSLGHFNNDPSVKGRLEAFDDAAHKLLYPERRLQSSDYASPAQLVADHGLIWRTPTETYLELRGTDLPRYLRRVPLPLPQLVLAVGEPFAGLGAWRAVPAVTVLAVAFALLAIANAGRPTATATARRRRLLWRVLSYGLAVVGLFVGTATYLVAGGLGNLRIGPIPAGTPVNLLANINPDAPPDQVRAALRATLDGLEEIRARGLQGKERDQLLATKVAPALMAVSKCPDFVMDKGHYYPWFADMTPADKEAVIELLKTF